MKNKLITFLLALLGAIGIWLFVVTVEQPESEQVYYDIPVVYQNEDVLADRGLMIVSERPTVTLKLKSTRSNLRNLNEANTNVLVNLANVREANSYTLNYSLSYPGSVPSGEISVVSASIEQVSLKVERRITKPVAVEPVYSGSVPPGMIDHREEATLDYTYIEVTGPESVVQNITQAVIRVDLEGQTQTIAGEYPYTLCDAEGNPVDSALLTTNVEAVNLVLKIQQVKEIELRVKVIAGGGATEQTSTITLDPGKIRVSGPEALLADLEYLEVGTIDLSTMHKEETRVFPIQLPEGITNETGVNNVSVNVQFPNLRTLKLTVNDIKIVGLPEGLEAELITQVLEVTVRGPAEQTVGLRASDLTVTVDLSNAQPGTFTQAATVTISSKYPEVGTMGNYSVSLTVTEAEEDK